jgi:hypothetical protein
LISQLALNAQNVQQLAQIAQIALNVQHVHSTNQRALSISQRALSTSQHVISRSHHVIVVPRLDEIVNHTLSLKPVVAMSQKILAQMIHISHQTWQMPI